MRVPSSVLKTGRALGVGRGHEARYKTTGRSTERDEATAVGAQQADPIRADQHAKHNRKTVFHGACKKKTRMRSCICDVFENWSLLTLKSVKNAAFRSAQYTPKLRYGGSVADVAAALGHHGGHHLSHPDLLSAIHVREVPAALRHERTPAFSGYPLEAHGARIVLVA